MVTVLEKLSAEKAELEKELREIKEALVAALGTKFAGEGAAELSHRAAMTIRLLEREVKQWRGQYESGRIR